MPPPRKYLPLCQFLAHLPADQASVRLTVAALEALVGPLPPSARNTPTYWTHGYVARGNWQLEGFTAQLDRTDRSVTFTRRRA